jgi:CubicO group peptidase (beta-lactamase class C family)
MALQPMPRAKPEEIGLNPQRLQNAYDLLEGWTSGLRPAIPGAALVVGRRGKIVPPRFFGRQGPEPDAEPIRPDGMFLLASITKPVTHLGAMLLVERGLLNLSDHVTRYIPDFAAHHKADTLVHHLFTHTSGMPDMLKNNVELRKTHAPLKKFIEGAIRDTVPLFRPGTAFSYQSMGTLIVAEIVQRITRLSIHDFLKREIFDPLGLRSTALGSQGFDRARLVRVETPDYLSGDFGWNSPYWQELGAPWGGMFSTPEDFAVICQMMLNQGTYGSSTGQSTPAAPSSRGASGGVRLLSPGTVRAMTANRLDDYPDLPEPLRRVTPWGLGWQLNHPGTPECWSDLLDRSVYGHTGATGTLTWIDPRSESFCILFTTAVRAKAPWRLVHVSNAVAAALVD